MSIGESGMVGNKFGNMQIKKIIVHQVFKRDEAGVIIPPFFSLSCATMNTGYSAKIKERIVKSMGNESHSIRMEIANSDDNSTYKLVEQFWTGENSENEFIDLSKKLTKLLADVQNNRRYPGGVIICVEGTVQAINKPFFCIIKAEMQDGFSLSKEAENLNLAYINDIFMTKNEKFQKMGLFINNAVKGRKIEPKDVDCFVFDSNTDVSISKAKAEYFYKTFLGMDFRKESDILTNNFVEATKTFIKSLDNVSDVKKIELSTSLLSYVRAEGTRTLNPIDFAETNFSSAETIDKYKNYLTARSIDLESIHKNTSMLGKWLKTRSLFFSNNVKLQIPADEFEDVVEILKDEESGETIVKIKGLMLDEK